MAAGQLLDGYITTQLRYVAASLGIAELLADGPLGASQIAATVGADPGMLTLGPGVIEAVLW